MGKTKKLDLDLKESAVASETVEQIMNTPQQMDAFAISPEQREALMTYLGTKPLNESENFYAIVRSAYPIKLTINPA